MRETPWGNMTYLAYKYKVEFGQSEYDEIDKYCKEKGIEWSASPWDLDSLEFLEQYDLPWLKIPSAMLTEESLLRECAKTGKKIIFSVGMSNLDEIDRAVEILREEQAEFAMLHCNSTYPAPLEELNLKCIQTLKERPHNVGIGSLSISRAPRSNQTCKGRQRARNSPRRRC
jgi:N-acetylneuraminate synthase